VEWNAEHTAALRLPAGVTGYQRVGHTFRAASQGDVIDVGTLPVMVSIAD
jgi:hypothetical protein